jgi:Domain of unknown function (DUF6973)
MNRVSEDVGHEAGEAARPREPLATPLTAASVGSFAWASAVGSNAVQRLARRRAAGRTLARLTPDEILDQYQVAEDKVEEWSPSLFGAIPIPGAPSRKLTVTEGKLLDELTFGRGLVGLSTFKDIAENAFARSEKEFPTPSPLPSWLPADKDKQREWIGNDGHRDAFRHCFWNARLTKEFGFEWTRQFTTAHEALPGNTASREAMDLYNNEVGRQIAKDNPKASVDELAKLVRKAVDDGKLIVVDRAGKLAWSNTVTVWDHGFAPSGDRPGKIAVPAGDASTS